MSKTLTTLIRFRKRQLDELRRRLTALESQKEQLIRRLETIRRELLREQEMASRQPEMSGFYGNYAERIRNRELEIAQEIGKLDRQMNQLSEQIRDSFGELKKFEILRERKLKEQREQEDRRETAQLDDIASVRDARRKREER